MNDGAAKWFVVRTNQRQEKLAAAALGADHVEAYLPMIVRETRAGAVGAPMFPSYLFIRLTPVNDRWRKVFTARGVRSVLTTAGRLGFMADRVVDAIRAREDRGFVRMALDEKPVHNFVRGQLVTVRKGPFAALPGVFQEPIDSRRCTILFQLVGESVRVAKVELSHLSAA